MKQKHSKRTTEKTRNTPKKHACPMTVTKQNQGTGKKLFDATKEKSTGPDIEIITGFTVAATPGLHAHLENLDPVEWQILNTALYDAHHDIVQTVLSILAAKGVAVSSLGGEVLRFTLQFLKNIPEEP
ncbi:hypothetical protein [uncultured Methanocorpusculum sp.]|nr:hypothetical protein [uncultured Methanocorpusculum sp.]